MKKGFTLIELLAIIIVLGLIAVIIVPKIQKTITDSKKNTYKISVEALEREADNFYITKKSSLEPFTGCEYDFTSNKNTCEGYDFKGKKPESGALKIASNGFTSYALKYDKYCYMNYGQSEPIIKIYNAETCKIDEPNSFSTDSWETISVAAKSNNISKYNVGDTKQIELENFGTHTVRIVNTSTPEECNTPGFSQTTCGFVIEFNDIITTHRMNEYDINSTELGNGGIGGWEHSEGRKYINNEIYNSLPEELKNSIKDTNVVSTQQETENYFITTDKLYLLETQEILGAEQNYTMFNVKYQFYGQLEYYKENPSDTQKKYQNKNEYWWYRTASSECCFRGITYDGIKNWRTSASNKEGISPAFRL